MHLEQEVYFLLILGFILIAVPGIAIMAMRYAKTRDKNLLWFAGQVLFLILAFYFCYRCIANVPNNPAHSMYSEEQSVILACTGICWAISMIFEYIGIWKFTNGKK